MGNSDSVFVHTRLLVSVQSDSSDSFSLLATKCESSRIITEEGNDGIGSVKCLSGTNNNIPTSFTTTTITEKIDSKTVHSTRNSKANFVDAGDIIVWTPHTSGDEPIDSVAFFPAGDDASRRTAYQSLTISFANDCNAFPVVEEGQSLGWLKIVSLDAPSYPCPAF